MKATDAEIRDAVRNFQEKKGAVLNHFVSTLNPFAGADAMYALDKAEARLMDLQLEDDDDSI